MHLKLLFHSFCLSAVLWSSLGFAQATAEKARDLFVLENEHTRIEVDSSAGARIKSWVIKPGNREMIALWKGRTEIGGALDDRAHFTAVRYGAAVMQPGPELASIRCEASHTSGLSIVKYLELRKGSPALTVRYEFRNGTQAPRRLFIRSFLLPGAHPQTDAHLYWVNGKEERKGTTTTGTTDAHGYYLPEAPSYAALWHKDSGDGILALAPGVTKFYFWRGSKEYPTFEWLYEDIPAGKTLVAQTRLIVASGSPGTPPDWTDICQQNSEQLREPSLIPLKGWVDEATQFGVTETERKRGFWMSVGDGEGKRRPPNVLEMDLAQADSRYLGLTLNLTGKCQGKLEVGLAPAGGASTEVFLQTDGEDRRELLPVPEEPVTWQAGERKTIWLHIGSQGLPPGVHEIPVAIRLGTASVETAVRLRVWPVQTKPQKPFHVRGYCGGFPVWTKGYDVTDDGLKHLDAILDVYSQIGGDVVDWNGVWARILQHTRIDGTEDVITDVAKKHPERIGLEALPKLDFSYFDPWLDLAKRRGVTRVETYLGSLENPQLSWRLLVPALGKGRVTPGSPESTRVIVWFYTEMKRYFESRGFKGFFCKISDEISPEHIRRHIDVASVIRPAGWRPFTTITGMIARTAGHITAMDPHCDQWQLSFGLKDDFLSLLNDKFVLSERSFPVPGGWRPYTNGGAQHTWGMEVLGERGAFNVNPQQVESFEMLEDGKPMRKDGGSPWGNRARGTVITGGRLHAHLYISPSGGTPEDHIYELRLTIRHADEKGKPLVRIDDEDEVWCYGGSSRPYRGTYGRSWCYPMMTLFHGFSGYGLWAFYHWNKTERIVWIDQQTHAVTISPSYCGYRDGWRDACLFSQLNALTGRETPGDILGTTENATLKVARKGHEVYSFTTVLNAGNPMARNLARRKALKLLSSGMRPE
ncbi:MAG: hypothetical protein HN742_23290 [Lentisphaerae bacterium]|jgi:hypothetical protein|nr:hypothetical protein [Lentisphaerota bacterium]MBT4818788.1 hypothetical protein [Lentisphaerota bacterium]MBT5608397.1 hypothetical protein [Lentisphaerota bacterium]MBT7054983.1 hypothetical protein [Lentisphaerota bacterium]MBT7844820.1 hypothetical protein [Lentisphaerota bacterium]